MVTKYVAFLRGINVGKNTKVEMSRLKNTFEELGFSNVKTLLNTGNVIFEVENSKNLLEKIESKLTNEFGFNIKVILRSKDQLEKLIKSDPFKTEKEDKSKRFYISFTQDKDISSVVDLSREGTVELMARLEKEYGKSITTRNWNTVKKIFDLL